MDTLHHQQKTENSLQDHFVAEYEVFASFLDPDAVWLIQTVDRFIWKLMTTDSTLLGASKCGRKHSPFNQFLMGNGQNKI